MSARTLFLSPAMLLLATLAHAQVWIPAYSCRVTNVYGTRVSNAANLSMPAPTGVTPDAPAATVFEALGPNPAATGATLAFSLAREGHIVARIHDVGGRVVRTLDGGRLAAGRHRLAWDGRAGGGDAAPGLYFVELTCDGRPFGIRRLTVLR